MSSEEVIVRDTEQSVDVKAGPATEQQTVVREARTVEVFLDGNDVPVVVQTEGGDGQIALSSTGLSEVLIERVEQPVEVRGPNDQASDLVVSADRARTIEVRGPAASVPNIVDLNGKFGIELAGAKDGANVVYTTPDRFIPSTLRLYVNGVRQFEGGTRDFTITGDDEITMSWALVAQDYIWADYLVLT